MPSNLRLLSYSALAASLFITFLLLWLGITTLLAARREHTFGRAAGVALLLASAFFLSHGMIVGKGPTTSGSGMEFWWRLGWLPAVSAPLTWYATVIRYAGLPERQQRLHRRAWLVLVAIGILVVALLIIDNPFSTYQSLLLGASPSARSRPLVWLYLALTVAGFSFAAAALVAGRGERVARIRAQARPWLIGTGLCLLGASGIVAVAAAWAVRNALPLLQQQPQTVNILLAADIGAQALVAGAAVLLGRAVVAYEVFTERPLPRQGFFRRWRSVVLTSAAAAGYITVLLGLDIRPLYGLASLALLGMAAYALFIWQSYRAHERFILRLLPFVTSLELSDRLLRPDAPGEFAQKANELLRALCEDALGAETAELTLEGDPPRHFAYVRQQMQSYASSTAAKPALRLDLSAGHGPSGTLILGARADGRPYAAEEVELARACGERLMDAVSGERIAHILMDLLRRRLGELQVLSTRHKRVLHDEVLPDIHLALLRLEDPSTSGAALARAHRTLSELLQFGAKPAAGQIESRGILGAIREAVERDFAAEFARIDWETQDEVEGQLKALRGSLAGEVIYYATLEAVRNAARHASGGDSRRAVHLRVAVRWSDGLELEVTDDGVGLRADASGPTSRQGLLFHSTMMAVVGGRLTVAGRSDGQGTTVLLRLPQQALLAASEPQSVAQ